MGEAAARLGITRQTFSARIAWCWSVVCFVKFLWAVSAFLLVRLSGCF
ncbi:hypothetical protein [Bifidobacterium breve]